MSATKGALKAIGASIQAAKYDEAVRQSQNLLANEPQNYQANLFLGFALDKQTRYAEAERAYQAAIKIKKSDPQAWQGLIKLFEKQGDAKVDEYQQSALVLAEIYRDADDKYRCQDVIDKFTVFARTQGTRQQHRRSLEILLPTSPIYDYLEGRIPAPAHTYQTIAQIVETEEKERQNKEIGERRTRLGATINQVTLDVQREIFANSPLEDLYSKIIDWSTDDDIRRQYEEKLVQRSYDSLSVLSEDQKDTKRAIVGKLATDMVIIKHPFKLAWDIAIEWKDGISISDWDAGVLRDYCQFFPTSGLAKVLQGFLSSEISPFPVQSPQAAEDHTDETEDEDDDDDEGGVKLNALFTLEDRLLLMSDGISEAPNSLLAHRALGEYYAFLDEHESVVELMRAGLKLVDTETAKTGLKFTNARESLTGLIGTSLVFYQSPRNHSEAKKFFESILAHNPTSTPALIGIGLIYEEEEEYHAALEFLDRAMLRDPDNVRVKAEAAWVKALNGDFERGRDELLDCLPSMNGGDQKNRDLRAQSQYRVGVCIWNIDNSVSARKDRKGAYSYFLAALKSNLNYAPAYTSLGIFYSDYSKDKSRARKCFQKAFELSASEVLAAERLAQTFAGQGDWDLVEIVAQRVIDSGKVKQAPGSKKRGISWPFAALGVAEMNKQDYPKSIVSFQSALRISPDDYHSWIGLGESYHNSGRHIAATKAFNYAEKFDQDVERKRKGDTWFAKYMLANVKRELGEYNESIAGYRAVLQLRPSEFGVSMALVQTLVESAWDSVEKGSFGNAASLAVEAIESAAMISRSQSGGFNLWKALGDACSIFSWVQARSSDFPHGLVEEVLASKGSPHAFSIYAEIDELSAESTLAERVRSEEEREGSDIGRCLQEALLCQKCAVHAATQDVHAQAVAYYNLGWTEYRSHTCLSVGLKSGHRRYIKAAVRCFKRAIELEAGNAEFWNALGVVTSELAPKISQHSFVRSLYLNEKNAQTWTNLGTFYLLQNDYQLANEAFTKAQSTDPEFAHAWLGQGLVALIFGDPKEARLLFTHAMEIAESSSVLAKRQYALSTFDQLLTEIGSGSIVDVVQPNFALSQLHFLSPSDISHKHLASMFLERIDDISEALLSLSTVCERLEADYEAAESPESLARFAVAKADLARCQLAAGSYGEAIESGETSLQLSAEDTGSELTKEARHKCRLSAHLTVGLAHYHSHDINEAVACLESALAEAEGNPDAVCLLAQMLWATGDNDSRNRARDQLFECVERNPGHLDAVVLLGTIAMLDGDVESLEAVTTDLQSLRTSHTVTDEEQGTVGEIFRTMAALAERDADLAVLSEIQSDIFLFPAQPHGWNRLAAFSGDPYASELAVKTALKSAPPRGFLEGSDLSEAFGRTGKLDDAQTAVMFAPWSQKAWDRFTRTTTE